MRDEADAKDHSTARLKPAVPWAVASVRVLAGHRLAVRFDDGTAGEVDASRLIFAAEPGVFARLRDPDTFAHAYVAHGAVSWPGDIDLAPEAMYDAIRATGVYTPE